MIFLTLITLINFYLNGGGKTPSQSFDLPRQLRLICAFKAARKGSVWDSLLVVPKVEP
jgi:hypothetical protein